jgi:uncharacterized protein (TIGR03545 family)
VEGQLMKTWIRWQGFITFLAIMVVCGILWFFLVDGWIERTVEKSGTRLVGAKVELDSADLSLFPAGLTLNRLQITDPDKPMTNAVEVGEIALTVDTLNLLKRKLIIEEMTVDEIQFNTPRRLSGALLKIAGKGKKPGDGKPQAAISFTLPDVKNVLKKEKLRSLEEINALKKDVRARKSKWEKRLSNLPDKTTFKQYEKRIKKIKKKGSKEIAVIAEILDIQKDMEPFIRELEVADEEFTAEIKSLKQKVKYIKSVQEKDIKRITNKYRFGGRGLANISKLLFGPKISGYIVTALDWYDRITPLLERKKESSGGTEVIRPLRGKGVNVRFKEHEPLPDLLVRNANASLDIKAGNISGTLNNITPDQDILGKPTVFLFSGKELRNIGSVEIAGSLDHIVPDESNDTIEILIKGLSFRDVILSEDEAFPVKLSEGIAYIGIKAELSGNEINSTLKATVINAHFLTKKRPANAVEKAVISVLKDISNITIKVGVSGTTDQYDIKISSNIDKALKRTASRQLKKEGDRFKKKVRSEIESQVKGPLNNAMGSFAELVIIDKEIGSRLNYATSVLKSSGEKPTGVLEKYLH